MRLIGILLREESEKLYVKTEIFEAIRISGGIPIGIYLKNYEDYLDICDGFVLPGGDNYLEDEINLIGKIYKINKPLLGICLGMQTIGIWANGSLTNIENHLSKDKYVHNLIIDKNSLLYQILNKEIINVNSRHKSALLKTNLKICARSEDGIIEVLEADNKKFFMGFQYHPESIISDENSKKIFTAFIEATKGE